MENIRENQRAEIDTVNLRYKTERGLLEHEAQQAQTALLTRVRQLERAAKEAESSQQQQPAAPPLDKNNIEIPLTLYFTYKLNVLDGRSLPPGATSWDVTKQQPLAWPTTANVLNVIPEETCDRGVARILGIPGNQHIKSKVLDSDACINIIRSLPAPLGVPLTEAFSSELDSWFRADLCKGAAVYSTGGFFADPDVLFRMPLTDFVDDHTSFIAAIGTGHYTQFFQGFFGATKQHPAMYAYLELMVEFYNKEHRAKPPWERLSCKRTVLEHSYEDGALPPSAVHCIHWHPQAARTTTAVTSCLDCFLEPGGNGTLIMQVCVS